MKRRQSAVTVAALVVHFKVEAGNAVVQIAEGTCLGSHTVWRLSEVEEVLGASEAVCHPAHRQDRVTYNWLSLGPHIKPRVPRGLALHTPVLPRRSWWFCISSRRSGIARS